MDGAFNKFEWADAARAQCHTDLGRKSLWMRPTRDSTARRESGNELDQSRPQVVRHHEGRAPPICRRAREGMGE